MDLLIYDVTWIGTAVLALVVGLLILRGTAPARVAAGGPMDHGHEHHDAAVLSGWLVLDGPSTRPIRSCSGGQRIGLGAPTGRSVRLATSRIPMTQITAPAASMTRPGPGSQSAWAKNHEPLSAL